MSSHDAHNSGGHEHERTRPALISLDSVPDIQGRLAKNESIPLSVEWSDLIQWAETKFNTGPWYEEFRRITEEPVVKKKEIPNPFAVPLPKPAQAPFVNSNIGAEIQAEPAKRTYLLYIFDLAKRARARNAPAGIFQKFYWDAAQDVPDGAEGFAGLWSSIDAEFNSKKIKDIDQRLTVFFKFCIRATSHERLWNVQPEARFSANVGATVEDFPFMKIAFPPAGFDEETLHHELEAMKGKDLIALLYFMREKLHTFSNEKQRHIADEIMVLIEDTLVKKLTTHIKSKNPENAAKAGEYASDAVNTILWKFYAKAHEDTEHDASHVRDHLAGIAAHNAPKGVLAKVGDVVGKVVNNKTIRGAATLGGISEVLETVGGIGALSGRIFGGKKAVDAHAVPHDAHKPAEKPPAEAPKDDHKPKH